MNLKNFENIVVVDFEFYGDDGDHQKPICVVSKNLKTNNVKRIWLHKNSQTPPPFKLDEDTLYVGFYTPAEMRCHLALDWPLPHNLLDLYVEFRNLTNGDGRYKKAGLIHAMMYFNLKTISVRDKEELRNLILSGGPYTDEEKKAILDYCQSDVEGTCELFMEMRDMINLEEALLRGRYAVAAAKIERNGIPIDTEIYQRLESNWEEIKLRLIEKFDEQYDIYEGTTFKMNKFADYLKKNNIPWPRTDKGNLKTCEDTFDEMSQKYPELKPLKELTSNLASLKLHELNVGSDGRNRGMLSIFGAKTSRNTPSTSDFIFSMGKWIRGLIKPEPGYGLAYIDWEQQEFGIAAVLSGDKNMIEAYETGDPYLDFAKKAGEAPEDATKETHPEVREAFKRCSLAVMYGMGEQSFAKSIDCSISKAKRLVNYHRRVFSGFWEWLDELMDYTMFFSELHTRFGWKINIDKDTSARTIRNFPMQANGSEILRLACCFATERGVKVAAPVHDAILIEAELEELDEAIKTTEEAMRKASEYVLDGFSLRTDVEKRIEYPERYMSEDGKETWNNVMDILEEVEDENVK